MKELMSFILKSLLFSVGLILCLTALSFLVNFTDSARLSNMEEEDFITFVFLFLVGIPTLLFGIKKLSNEDAI